MSARLNPVEAGPPPTERMAQTCRVAAAHADEVDREGRFPREAMASLRENALLGIQVPASAGGEGLSLRETASLCTMLGEVCASTAMIFAMHQIKVASLVASADDNAWLREFTREVARRQLLLGSATTEGGIGGDLRNSICAVEVQDGRYRLGKDATVISYGEEADAILATARRAPDAAGNDQVMVVVRREDCSLVKTTTWDTLGMRGTCSDGFRLEAEGTAEQIFPKPFSEIAAQSMLATSHILWSAVWFGIAANAMARAQAFVRAEIKRRPGQTPPGALRLAEAGTVLQQIKANISGRIQRCEAARGNPDDLSTMSFAVEMNNLKVSSAELATIVVNRALLITGILGYKNGTPFSVGRHLRDIASAAIMISNDRILSNTANMLLVSRIDTSFAA